MSILEVRPAGERALLIELSDLDSVLALNGALLDHPLPGQAEVLPAARTVQLSFNTPEQARAAMHLAADIALGESAASTGRLIEIPVHYDGADLAAVAELTGLSVAAVIDAHCAQQWTAAFGGFAPGFAYLAAENDTLQVPRRDSPRTAVPAGSVALAGNYSAVYPRESPGGWQLLGHTELQMWDSHRENPALIAPRDIVRFRAVPARATLSEPTTAQPSTPPSNGESAAKGPGLRILDAGLQSLLQDEGRAHLGHLGVPRSGAADLTALHQANRLVGNHPARAAIENLTGRLEVQAQGDLVLALAGADVCADITPAEHDELRRPRPAPLNAPFALLDGERLRLSPGAAGLRSYLSIRGGFAVEAELGSCSSDTLSGLGPAPLCGGDFLPVTPVLSGHIVGAPEPSTLPLPEAEGHYLLRITPGPRADWFGASGLTRLTEQDWVVSSDSNRVGMRLSTTDQGQPLERTRTGELQSEGVPLGALQVPPNGLPVLFLADHPVTGGYPVIATVREADVALAAQLPPGTHVRFTLDSPGALNPATR
ncbi:carboxyltransferase domain-containing protein [Glutamicibacter endophyticus]|uniref:5-oxoprolinase subunit B/C family protein n=1 Tax=Glutamicibacter endophyticus TaxID=1522174 RepID=UPI003AF164BA